MSFGAAPISPKLSGARRPRVGLSIRWARPSLSPADAKTGHLCLTLSGRPKSLADCAGDPGPAPHFAGLQITLSLEAKP